jgi:hypothetical protein
MGYSINIPKLFDDFLNGLMPEAITLPLLIVNSLEV